MAPQHLRRLRHRRIECPHGNDFWKMAEYKHMRFVHRLYEFPYDHCAPIFRRGGGRRRAQSTVTNRSEPAGRPQSHAATSALERCDPAFSWFEFM